MPKNKKTQDSNESRIKKVQEKENDWLVSLPRITGTGIKKNNNGRFQLTIYCHEDIDIITINKIRMRIAVPIVFEPIDSPT